MKVEVYSTQYCPACNMLKEFLSKNKIKYENITVGEDMTPEEFSTKTGSMGVPVIYVDDEMLKL
jgi:glutaredoxin